MYSLFNYSTSDGLIPKLNATFDKYMDVVHTGHIATRCWDS